MFVRMKILMTNTLTPYCHTLISSGDYYFYPLILSSQLTVLSASYSAKQMIIQCFKNAKDTEGGAKGSFHGVFGR